MKKFSAISLIVLCVVYLINPSAGVFELLPDNLPLLGNVDETLAAFLLFSAIQYIRTGTFVLPRNRRDSN